MKTTFCMLAIIALFPGLYRAEATTPPGLRMAVSQVTGIGPEKGVMRRDPSDIIRVGNLYYVWYTKGNVFHGFSGTIWYATSSDGRNWTEQGMAVGKGPSGSWHAYGVYTPNIMVAENRYWLFFSAAPTVVRDRVRTSIGLAVADTPDGPWMPVGDGPALLTSDDRGDFDSLRVDDAGPIVLNGTYHLYYKGRQWDRSPSETKLGVAIADSPEGPYVKHEANPLIPAGHEVMVWRQGTGVIAMINKIGPPDYRMSLQYAPDGIRFSRVRSISHVPGAGGFYCPEAFTGSDKARAPTWGLQIGLRKDHLPYLVRTDFRWEPDLPLHPIAHDTTNKEPK